MRDIRVQYHDGKLMVVGNPSKLYSDGDALYATAFAGTPTLPVCQISCVNKIQEMVYEESSAPTQ